MFIVILLFVKHS